ncbi:MAG: ABC transporter substrate-binding protein [Anaerovoracaceae bacterium]|jgi:branched-chain amino acid transport system substrate-binding protein
MKKFKKSLILLLALVLVMGSLAACGGDNADNGSGDNGEAATEVKIGINYELTGPVASYGQSSVDGIMMAFDEINEAGGIDGKIKIVPVKVDNKSEPAEATSLATRLMTQDKVVACLGPATSGDFMATIPVAMGNKIPIISASATADEGVTIDTSGNVNDYVFRLCFNDSFQGVTMANFAADNLGATKAVLIQDKSSDYAEGLAKNFIATFESAGGEILAHEGYVSKDKDFNGILTSVRDLDYDVIFIPGYYQEAGLIIKQARDLGITAPILGADGFDSPVLLELAGEDALTDVYFSNHYSSLDQDPLVQDFIAGYNEKYGTDPNAFNALGYDLGYFIADAISRAGSTNPEDIKDALASTVGFAGVTGTFDMGEDHNPIKSIVVIKLENGVQASSVKVNPN